MNEKQADLQYPRWLYIDNDLTKGVIVCDQAQAEDARKKGYSEYDPKKGEPKKEEQKSAKK